MMRQDMRFRAVVFWLLALVSMCVGAHTRDTVEIGLQLEPPVLDPTTNPAAPIGEVVHGTVFENLVKLAPDGTPKPWLATSWSVSDDGLEYRFTLREGVRFHDGSPFDAESARFSLARAIAGDSLNPERSELQAVIEVSVEAGDAKRPRPRVRVKLSHRDSGLLQTLGLPGLAMVSPASATNNAQQPVGTGPFRFERWRRGDRVELVRNEDYWDGAPALQRVAYRFIADPNAAYAALMAGDLDAFPNYPAPESLPQFEADARFALDIGTSTGKALVAINQRREPLGRVEVRRALTQAIDRRAVIDGAMSGYGEPIGSHLTPVERGYVDVTDMWAFDPEAARAVLKDVSRPLRLVLPPPSYARRGGEIVAAQLSQAGLDVRIEQVEWAQWLDQVYARRDFDLTVIVHAEPLDLPIYGRDNYYFGYESPAARELLAKLGDARTRDERDGVLRALQYLLADDAVNVWLFAYPRLSVRDARLTGLGEPGLLGRFDVAKASFAEGTPPRAGQGTEIAMRWLAPVVLLPLLWLAWLLVRRFGFGYLLRRFGVLAATLLAATLVVFAATNWLPGDPASHMLGMKATPEAIELLREQLGLNTPAWLRYVQWLGGMLQGDFGTSYTYRVPIAPLLLERLAVSLPLAVMALLLSVAAALPLGVLAAAWRGKIFGAALDALAQIGVSVPGFWVGMLLVLLFSVKLGWVPAGGFPGWQAGIVPALASLLLPSIALALPQSAVLARMLRASLVEAASEDYVRTARAKGCGRLQALLQHALPNALLPLLTVVGLQFGYLIAGSVIIENVFFLPGLGRLVFQAVTQRDLAVVQAVTVLIAGAVVTLSFLVEMLYALADPRLRIRVAGNGVPA